MTAPRRLTAVPGTSKKEHYDAGCRIAIQAVLEGMQEVRVQGVTPLTGPGHGQIAIRRGRILMYINDREAMDSLLDAYQQAAAMADKAYGAELAPPRPNPRSRKR